MKAFSVTDIGRRRAVNQDYIFCEENPIGKISNLFIVADGMGGHKAGDCASRVCVEKVVESIQQSQCKTPVSMFEEAIHYANKIVLQMAKENPELEGMGTTFVAATIQEDKAYIANIGDSRLYLLNEKGIRQITEDHSLVEAMVRKGEIDKLEARFHPQKNIITRALGTTPSVFADYFEIDVMAGDVLMLCSDGLSNMIEDEDILYIVRKYTEDMQKAVDKLLDTANEYGGKDNISIIMVQI